MQEKIYIMHYWNEPNNPRKVKVAEREMMRFITNSSFNPWIEYIADNGDRSFKNTAHMLTICFEAI